MKIAILIPSTSNGRDWKTFEETYLYKHTLKTFLMTYNKEYNSKFFIGIDRGDKIYDNPIIKEKLERFLKIMKTVGFHTFGCKLNFSETSSISREFTDNGYKKKSI